LFRQQQTRDTLAISCQITLV